MNYTQKKLKELNQDLTRIMADGSDEKVMILTVFWKTGER